MLDGAPLADRAITFLSDDATVFIDAGTTMTALATRISQNFRGLIVTPAPSVALAALHRGARVHLIGGPLSPDGAMTLWCAYGHGPALIALALAPSALTLGLCLFLFGMFHGAMDVAMNGWGARVETRLNRSATSRFHAMFSLGASLGASSGYIAARLGVDLLGHFAFVALSGTLAAILILRPAQPDHIMPPRTSEKPLFALPSGPLAPVGLIAFAAAMGEGAMADWSAVLLRITTEVSEAKAALGYAVVMPLVFSRAAADTTTAPARPSQASPRWAMVGYCLALRSLAGSPIWSGCACHFLYLRPLLFWPLPWLHSSNPRAKTPAPHFRVARGGKRA